MVAADMKRAVNQSSAKQEAQQEAEESWRPWPRPAPHPCGSRSAHRRSLVPSPVRRGAGGGAGEPAQHRHEENAKRKALKDEARRETLAINILVKQYNVTLEQAKRAYRRAGGHLARAVAELDHCSGGICAFATTAT